MAVNRQNVFSEFSPSQQINKTISFNIFLLIFTLQFKKNIKHASVKKLNTGQDSFVSNCLFNYSQPKRKSSASPDSQMNLAEKCFLRSSTCSTNAEHAAASSIGRSSGHHESMFGAWNKSHQEISNLPRSSWAPWCLCKL